MASNKIQNRAPLRKMATVMFLFVGLGFAFSVLINRWAVHSNVRRTEEGMQELKEPAYRDIVFLALMGRSDEALAREINLLDSKKVIEATHIGEFVRKESRKGTPLFRILLISEKLYRGNISESTLPFTALSNIVPNTLLSDDNIGVLLEIASSSYWNRFILNGQNIETVKSILQGNSVNVDFSSYQGELPDKNELPLTIGIALLMASFQFFGLSMLLITFRSHKYSWGGYLWCSGASYIIFLLTFPVSLVFLLVWSVAIGCKSKKKGDAVDFSTESSLANSSASGKELLDKLEQRSKGGMS